MSLIKSLFVSLLTTTLLQGKSASSSSQPASGPADAPLRKLVQPRAPLTPQEAVKSFKTEPGIEVQLVAAEPEVTDPIALTFDEDGRMYVAEMRDYPYNPENPASRVRLLEDRDGDGRYETSRIFADKLHWASGIACWKGGVFVTAPPDIFYLKDTDGDGAADLRQVVFTGFGTESAEDIMNNPLWGLDHLIYGVTSYNAGEVRCPPHPERRPVPLRNRDFRFDPRTLAIEPQSGNGDFGNAFDDFGHRFVCNAGHVAIFPVIPLEYLGRNPFLGVSELAHDITVIGSGNPVYAVSPPEPWRVVRQQMWDRFVNTTFDMRAERFGGTELIPHGHVTGAAGITVYRGSALPSPYRGCVFTGEAANNLIIRTVPRQDGPSYVVERPKPFPSQEFVASTDDWFRPVNSINAPDGCLYVADMYRGIIEDPSAIPHDILEHLDMLSGQDMGRIYRIAPTGFRAKLPPHLSTVSTTGLVKLLEHPDSWWRDTAHRLLYERQDRGALPALRELLKSSTHAAARVCTLWSIEGLGDLKEGDVLTGLHDEAAGIREQAVRLAERFLPTSSNVRESAMKLTDDENARVRFQATFSLGGLDTPESDRRLARIARRDADNHWMRTALLSAPPRRAARLFANLAADPAFVARSEGRTFLHDLALIVGSEGRVEAVTVVLRAALLDPLADDVNTQRAFLLGLGEGLARSGGSLVNSVAADPALKTALDRCQDRAGESAADESRPSNERVDNIGLLARADFERARRWLTPLLDARQPAAIQIAAVRALTAQKNPDVGKILVGAWRTYSPPVRREVMEAMLSRAERIPALLDAMEAQEILPNELDPARRDQLVHHGDQTIRERARQIFTSTRPGRAEVIARYRPSLQMKGDPARGEVVYQKACASCHRAGSRGHSVGPDFNTVLEKPADWLLENILNPNQQVQANYVDYVVETQDGETLTGIIVAETADSVTLRRAEGAQDTILRSQIRELRSTTLSIMPEELESGIDLQQMADLIAFIQRFNDVPASPNGGR